MLPLYSYKGVASFTGNYISNIYQIQLQCNIQTLDYCYCTKNGHSNHSNLLTLILMMPMVSSFRQLLSALHYTSKGSDFLHIRCQTGCGLTKAT